MTIFIILKTVLLFSLFISGFLISKKNQNLKGEYFYPYHFAIFPSVIVYSCVEGLRYARGADYFSYLNSFVGLVEFNYEPIFNFFVNFISYANFPFYFGFLFCSFFLIISACFLIKEFRYAAFFMLPLFYLDTIVQSTNLVRMYFAFSLVLIAMKFLINDDFKKFFLFFIAAFFSHYSSIVLLPFILFFKKFHNPFKNRYIILLMFFVTNLSTFSQEAISDFVLNISNLGFYDNYLESTNRWILGEGLDYEETQFSVFYYIRFIYVPVFIIWFGYELIDKYKNVKFYIFYHLYCIGTIFLPFALSLPTEMFYRLALYFISFKFLVLAIILYYNLNRFSKLNILVRTLFIFCIFDQSYLLIKTIGVFQLNDSQFLLQFIWDKLTY